MKKILGFSLLALFSISGCAHDKTTAPSWSQHQDREFNPVSGNYERQPPFGPRGNKSVD